MPPNSVPLLVHVSNARPWAKGSRPFGMRSFSAAPISRSTSERSASAVAASFLSRFQSLGPQTRTQILDGNQLRLLSLTLNRPSLFPDSPSLSSSTQPPFKDTPLPPGYHLVYFTPAFSESELGADGTDTSYNPDAPFTRRMWAGGEVQWPRDRLGQPNPLRIGQEVQESTRVLKAEPKVAKKTGEEMIVVGVEKEFRNEQGIAVIDRRNWVFRKGLPPPPPSHDNSPKPLMSSHIKHWAPVFTISENGKKHTRTLMQTPVTLFRFSALTFNPHKIHYSLPWTRDVEGHKDLVVHGPLNLVSILDLWRDTRKTNPGEPRSFLPESISYRATSPLYAGEEYQIVLEEEGGVGTTQIFGPGGAVAMKAEIKQANVP